MDVNVDMGNEGGTITITIWPTDDHERRCASPPYTVQFS